MATQQLGLNKESEFLLLDLREQEEYNLYHIREAINFPAPNISRDRFLPEMYRFRNQPGKLIIVYTWEERAGVSAAQKFAEKGFENVFLISGGLESFSDQAPEMMEGTKPPSPKKKPAPKRKPKSNTNTQQRPQKSSPFVQEPGRARNPIFG